MASDLSKIIQDSFTLTLNGLLAKDAKILEITKAHIKDIENLQLLKVQSTFDFTNFTSQLSFIIPAKSCSLIFNTMMGSPIDDLSDEIDDDSEDAIGEFVSNTSGTLTTSINSENLEDIGQAKFNIASKETISSSSLNEIDKLYKYKIDLEDSELIIFILFDDELLPYLEDTAAAEVTHHEEEIIEEIEEDEKELEEVSSTQKDTSATKDVIENKEPKETKTVKKEINLKDKNKKIIMIAGGVLGVILILLLIMYFIGIFDSEVIEEKKPEDIKKTKIVDPNKVDVIKYKTTKKVNFKASDINKERLNNKLLELTKYKVLNQDELEAQKLAEKNRLFELEKEKQLLAFAKKNQEEPLLVPQETVKLKIIDKKTINKDITLKAETPTNNKGDKEIIKPIEIVSEPLKEEKALKYVVTNSLKYSLFKSLVQETNTTQARISICNNDKGKTTIYIGPFETEELQSKMIELMNKNSIQINAENITEENFNLKCNLE